MSVWFLTWDRLIWLCLSCGIEVSDLDVERFVVTADFGADEVVFSVFRVSMRRFSPLKAARHDLHMNLELCILKY